MTPGRRRRGDSRRRPLSGAGIAAQAVAFVAALSLALAACDAATPPQTDVPAVTDAAPSAAPPASTPLETIGPPPSATDDGSAPVTIDSSLLGYLPPILADSPVTEDVTEAATALGDPALPRIATGLDAAVAGPSGTGDLVVAWLVRLRSGAFGDEVFRQWRDSYDEGACAAAGGILGNAEADIGGRHAFITSCAGGLHTYHLWLEAEDVLISASSIGEGRYGELLLADLRVPGS